MNRILTTIIIIGIGYVILLNTDDGNRPVNEPTGVQATLPETGKTWQSDSQVNGSGVVTRILSDDLDGSRHQRFILRLASGQTLLIAHNIDLAPRVSGLSEGDVVEFYGEYERNDQGGVIHWTHHDPQNRHVAGWLKHRGRTYQ